MLIASIYQSAAKKRVNCKRATELVRYNQRAKVILAPRLVKNPQFKNNPVIVKAA